MIDRPELHSHVTFYAVDPDKKQKLLLNGEKNISMPAVTSCADFVDVSVAAEIGIRIFIIFFERLKVFFQNHRS